MVIGIDLGTTYSSAAYLDRNDIPQIITNAEGEESTPSVVFVDGENVVVGRMARKKALRYPNKTCKCVKMNMGNRVIVLKDEEHEYSPEVVSAMILKRILNDSEKRLDEKIEGVVVTVPTYFDDSRRTATKNAIECLGIPLIGMIDEPKAAALCYCYQNALEGGKVLVYDFGGGTFDATLLQIDGNHIDILAEGGEHEAGGAYFDDAIANYVMDEVLDKHGINLKEEQYSALREEILFDAESCKKELSSMPDSTIFVRCPGAAIEVTITREKFNELIENMVYRTLTVIEEMLEENGIEPEEVDKILLVGGSSHIPYVRERLKEMFQKDLSEKVDPNKAVAYGAAIYADLVKGEVKKQKMVLSDVCAHGIGLLRWDSLKMTHKVNDVLIQPNTKIPASTEAVYETMVDHQRYIDLELTEGELEDADLVHIISEMKIELPGSSNLPKGTEVGVQLKVNENHLVEVYLNIPSLDFHKEYKIKRIDNLTEEELQKMSGLVASKNIR